MFAPNSRQNIEFPVPEMGLKLPTVRLGAVSVATEPVRIQLACKFGDDFELDFRAYELRRAGQMVKLEPTPFELLVFLVEQRGNLVGRQQIAERIWGKGVFLDTDNSINGAIRKIRLVRDDDHR